MSVSVLQTGTIGGQQKASPHRANGRGHGNEEVTSMQEQPTRWAPIPDFDGYEVSSDGQVRSFNAWHGQPAPRLLHPNISSGGYPRVVLRQQGRKAEVLVHSLVLRAFVGPRPPKGCTRHLDGDKTNNKLTNLVWGTSWENMNDKHRHGTMPRGEAHANAKLTEDDVRSIRHAIYLGEKSGAVAKRFGVSYRAVYHILIGKTWGHVPLPINEPLPMRGRVG